MDKGGHYLLSLKKNQKTTARAYVDTLEKVIGKSVNAFKGEHRDEPITSDNETQIRQHLAAKLIHTSVTIVLISANMKDHGKKENEQYIPWEIAYSLRINTTKHQKSRPNAILAVVLPDQTGSYSYMLKLDKGCNHTFPQVDRLFPILKKNMFNRRNHDGQVSTCNGKTMYTGDHSYIPIFRWDKFISNYNHCVQEALRIKKKMHEYALVKKLEG